MEFFVVNFDGPNLTIEVTNTGYLIDGRKVSLDIAWLFDMSILAPGAPGVLASLIEVYMAGMRATCDIERSDVLDIVIYVAQRWELEPC